MDDLEYIKERQKRDTREVMVSMQDSRNAPTLAPALIALRKLLSDSKWHPWATAVATLLRGSDVKVKTVDNLMRNLIVAGMTERRGEYVRRSPKRPAQDGRMVRMLDWPEVSG